jgi:hypothetical protein
MKENNYTTRRVDEIEDRLKKMKLKWKMLPKDQIIMNNIQEKIT